MNGKKKLLIWTNLTLIQISWHVFLLTCPHGLKKTKRLYFLKRLFSAWLFIQTFLFSISLHTKTETCFRNLLKLWKNECSKILKREIWMCDLLLLYIPMNWDCEIGSLTCLCTAVLYAMQFSALWKLHIKSVPLFNWLKCFSALTVGFFYKLHHLKNNEMSLFRIHGSGKQTAQQRRFNWIGCILHVLSDVFMSESLWVSFMVDDQMGVYFSAISHCYVWCHLTCVIWEMYTVSIAACIYKHACW